MRQPTVRRFFPGGNTMGGFYSYYQYLWRPLANPSRPGVDYQGWARNGQIGAHAAHRGRDARPGLRSGTAPLLHGPRFRGRGRHPRPRGRHRGRHRAPRHRPRVPRHGGDHGEPGRLLGRGRVRRQRADIEAISARYKGCYASAYNYLAAAGVIHDEWRAADAAAQDWGKVHQFVWGLLADVLRGKGSGAPGYVRKLFATAITPEGFRHHLESVFGAASRRIVLAGEPGTGKSMVVSRLAQALSEHGMAVEVFHCGLRPEEPEHLFAPEVGLFGFSRTSSIGVGRTTTTFGCAAARQPSGMSTAGHLLFW